MTREEIFNILKEVISTIKPKLDVNTVTESSQLITELGLDSLSMLLIAIAIENRFGIQVDNTAGLQFQKASDVIDYIEKKL